MCERHKTQTGENSALIITKLVIYEWANWCEMDSLWDDFVILLRIALILLQNCYTCLTPYEWTVKRLVFLHENEFRIIDRLKHSKAKRKFVRWHIWRCASMSNSLKRPFFGCEIIDHWIHFDVCPKWYIFCTILWERTEHYWWVFF